MGEKTYAELFRRYEGNPILRPEEWPYPVNAVFNPAAALVDGETVLLVRVEDRSGKSHLTAARSRDGLTGWRVDPEPTLLPDPENHPEEIWGIEDPRVTRIEELGAWAVVYTAYSRGGPLVSLATTKDFRRFHRYGPIFPPEDKDAALFPVRFGGRWAMLHRPVPAFAGVGAHVWLSRSPDLRHWGDHRVLLWARRGAWWDADKIGVSPPPLETEEGWLVLYHGVRTSVSGAIYRLGLALLDRDEPRRILHRSDEWVLGPKEWYELQGDVEHVVFPCGWTLRGRTLTLYYGASDTCVAAATADLDEVLAYVKTRPRDMRRQGGSG